MFQTPSAFKITVNFDINAPKLLTSPTENDPRYVRINALYVPRIPHGRRQTTGRVYSNYTYGTWLNGDIVVGSDEAGCWLIGQLPLTSGCEPSVHTGSCWGICCWGICCCSVPLRHWGDCALTNGQSDWKSCQGVKPDPITVTATFAGNVACTWWIDELTN